MTNNSETPLGGPSLSKRSFLKGSAAALGVAGLPLFARGAAAQTGTQGVVSGCT